MDAEEFRKFGKAAIDYLVTYFSTVRENPVRSQVEPGYLQHKLPLQVPVYGEKWQNILQDIDKFIVPGLSNWHSPHFHAYYPTANSYPGIVAEIFVAGLGTLSSDWTSNPACLELEVKMMDWLAKLLGLPEHFLNSPNGTGAGVIQNAASEATLVALLSSISRTMKQHLKENPHQSFSKIRGKLVAYTSEQSNSSVEKAGLLASVPMRLLSTDKNGSLRGCTLLDAIKKDRNDGLIPCCVVGTLGTTGTCAFDNLEELGEICEKERIWLHVDAAYAGSAFACPEYRYLMKGVEYADSFNFNPHKWMLVNSDCSAMWFKDRRVFEDAYKVTSKLLQSEREEEQFPIELQRLQIPNCRRFRSLKLWFVLRIYGVEGIQKHIRQQIFLAKFFAHLVEQDHRCELLINSMGLVCFRLKGDDDQHTLLLLEKINERNKIYIMPYYFRERYVVRFVVCSRFTEKTDIIFAWNEIQKIIDEMFVNKIIKEFEINNNG